MENILIYQGRLTRDPEIKTTGNGVEVCNFTVAWSKKVNDTEVTCFLDCTAWRNTAQFIEKYFSKGKEIIIRGELSTQKYTDKDGNPRSKTVCTVEKAHFAGSGGGKSDGAALPEGFALVEAGSDDLPFDF